MVISLAFGSVDVTTVICYMLETIFLSLSIRGLCYANYGA